MAILGLVLVVAAVVFGADLALTNNVHQVPSPVVFGQSLGVHTDWWVFAIGAIAGAVAMLGLSLMTGGAFRGGRRRRLAERDEQLAAVVAERDRLRADNERLARLAPAPVVREGDAPVARDAEVVDVRDRREEVPTAVGAHVPGGGPVDR